MGVLWGLALSLAKIGVEAGGHPVGMIDENWLKVALKSMALGVGLYVIPLGMIANPQLIQLQSDLPAALGALLQMCLGLSCISYAIIALKNPAARIALLTAGLAIVFARLWL